MVVTRSHPLKQEPSELTPTSNNVEKVECAMENIVYKIISSDPDTVDKIIITPIHDRHEQTANIGDVLNVDVKLEIKDEVLNDNEFRGFVVNGEQMNKDKNGDLSIDMLLGVTKESFIDDNYHENAEEMEAKSEMAEKDIKFMLKNTKCDVCNKIFKSHSLLTVHLRSHSGEKPFICTNCGKGFSVKSNLQQHALTHTSERPFSCGECPSKFKTERLLKVHNAITHCESKPFSCQKCGTRFKVKRNLKVHMKIHSGMKPFKCDACDYTSVRKSCLVTHQWTHNPQKRFTCGECEQSFTTKAKLRDHFLIHNNIKPYKCTNCDRAFTRKDNLKVHVRSHIGTKPYKCVQCDKLFQSSQGFRAHMKNGTHKSENFPVKHEKIWDEVPMKPNMVSVQLMTPYF